jgi:signal transduction histidine kinase/ActR/RegA family two-component response regulator
MGKDVQELTRMTRALSRSRQAMARARDEAGYLAEVCRIVAEDCGYFLVWIGQKEDDPGRSVRPIAWSGFEDGYLNTLRLTWADQERGQGPSGTAIRTGLPSLCRNVETDPRFAPWREDARARGYASTLGLPLLDEGEAFGAITVYAPEPDAFSDAEVRVLGELADDLAYTIRTLRLRESEHRAQQALRETTLNLQRLNEELEQRVRDRTAELVQANEALTMRLLDRDKALEALRQSEEQLRHAQKMEAVGTLAGGVAHDFNNLLQVIDGYAELALADLGQVHPLRESLEAIRRAGQKGAALTRQLLAFSRRQVLAEEIVDLNALVREMEKFCRRVVEADIRLVLVLAPDLGPVKADPNQMEQVIMNLVVNARDAMPQGGTLTLETRNRGPWVTFSVTDTGTGMAAEVLGRIFEPFFTTKGIGKGTGLGLSTALGIVEQSGGSLDVQSGPGLGTTFMVTLPRAAAGAPAMPRPAELEPEHGTETVLLVEDDEGVRQLTAHHLASSGYRVIAVGNGAAALERLQDLDEPVHLLLTDVVMPGMNGWTLAGRARALQPAIRVVFMSGHPDDARSAGEALAGRPLIAKPFDRATLLAAVRKALSPAIGKTMPT